ncbi:hypothetical protein PGTUg99_009890 [Puccinia graminis f. sp. tritici]|uniref:Uncharacterized protein n=1 Tax=Puccinia graminis f. sp. tritici TaxID=56615 RepID=A0A5B0NSA9_PUCGR|nr:hypothetical protein PGTUg99_009890 [Puccinia graminis f. sp. tritici]
METTRRPINLDISALSPTEYQAYQPFITQFNHFTTNTHGKLRFAQAAEFLRRYYRFQTEREDEIRSFFPQEIQLGQIDLGSILAILRLLSHLHHQPTTLKLTQDLVFIQTQPIPSSSSSNPFRRSIQNSADQSTTSPPYCFPQSLSANDLPTTSSSSRLPSSSSNPFKQRSLSAATSNNQQQQQQSNLLRPASPESQHHHHHLPSPKIPPRPTRLSKLNTTNLSTPASSDENRIHKSASSLIRSSSDIKPPPKHYSQRSKTLDPSLDHFDPFDPPPPPPHTYPSSSKNPTTTPSSEVHLLHLSPSKLSRPRFIEHQHAQNLQNGSPIPSDSKPMIPPPPPPPIPTKPIRAQKTEGPRATKPEIEARPEKPHTQLSTTTLHRAQTFNDHHQSRRNRKVPALPSADQEQEKKQRRPESLHESLHNPFAVSLDELVGSFSHPKDSGTAALPTPQEGGAGPAHQPSWDPKPSARGLPTHRANHKSPESRRSVSLFFHQDHLHNHPAHHHHPHSDHSNKKLHQNFKDFEKEIKHDSKLIVDELVVGWTSRFGIKDERAPLVDKS